MAKDLYELNDDGDEANDAPAPPPRAPKAKPDVERGTDDLEVYDLEIEQIDIEPPRRSRKSKPKRPEPAATPPVEADPAFDVEPVAASEPEADSPAESSRRLIFPGEGKYCIHCGGKMRDLIEPECPHCHAPFAVNDTESYSDEPVVGRRDQTEPMGPRLAWIGGVFVVGWLIGFLVLWNLPIFGPTPMFVIWIPVLIYLAMPLFPEYWTDSLFGHIAVGAVIGGVAGLTFGPDFTLLFGILMGAFTGLVRRNTTMG